MPQNSPLDEIKMNFVLGDGSSLVLLERLAKWEQYGKQECARNIYLLDSCGKVVWQVFSDFDDEGAPFTHISVGADGVSAYRWDGGTYAIDLLSGFASPGVFSR